MTQQAQTKPAALLLVPLASPVSFQGLESVDSESSKDWKVRAGFFPMIGKIEFVLDFGLRIVDVREAN